MNLNGQRLRTIRDGKGISRAELSRMVNVSIETIKRAENNEHKTNAETVAKIAAALNVPMESLFDAEAVA